MIMTTEKIMQITWMKQKRNCYSVKQQVNTNISTSIETIQVGNRIVLNISNISNVTYMLVIADSTGMANSTFTIGMYI